MTETLPDPKDVLSNWKKLTDHPNSSDHCFDCETVTPLYGGGVKACEIDQEMPIRPTAIRGQLRFWWRLLNHTSSKALFAAETAIWGGIGGTKPIAGKVRLWLDKVDKVQPQPAFEFEKKNGQYKSTPKALDVSRRLFGSDG